MIKLGKLFGLNKSPDHIFSTKLKVILGFRPNNTLIYKTAFTHKSKKIQDKNGLYINYERLEFLGDSILSVVISDYLYSSYPEFNEGDLTKLRSKIVNRESLNKIGFSLKLIELIDSNHLVENSNDNIHGNILESLIGAVYLDSGFDTCKKFILNKIIHYFINFETINSSILSYKGALIEWSQKNKHKLNFKTTTDNGLTPKINFLSSVFLNNKLIAKATEVSKKKAEEKVSKKAYKVLKIKFIGSK
ncbi:MAG: ribonuclease III [Flavobacteriaceae bacterium]|nr:ribonuclease III [Flavobacteriaceae bacterium]MBQ21903.1 ribonuclease III [Flavobacteriales bacterium]